MTPQQLREALAGFTGTENYYRHTLGILYTDRRPDPACIQQHNQASAGAVRRDRCVHLALAELHCSSSSLVRDRSARILLRSIIFEQRGQF